MKSQNHEANMLSILVVADAVSPLVMYFLYIWYSVFFFFDSVASLLEVQRSVVLSKIYRYHSFETICNH